ncbi:serine dehydratase subunit alpha family protein [Candidatus Epulonipiscium viviparus]|uniref:L-cysteine desulfidase family protein n=1 Tax=Candidatus Epulonipiscium viviparus TaxID=420336 RepID=UPI0027380822|nr:L-serine ammonia-lyase, iron-sulfur-dependent, subunit alpha [Candidatus Epulopiscium viviparus]
METQVYNEYLSILREELVPAMGCTEPIAIAFVAAKAREVLGEMPDKIVVKCSGNMIKNTMCVTVPNTGDLTGIEASAIIGAIAGDASKELEVISSVTDEQIEKTKELLNAKFCTVLHLDSSLLLHVIVEVYKGEHVATAEITEAHTHISKITKDGQVLFYEPDNNKYLGKFTNRDNLSVCRIYEFANTVEIAEVKDLLDLQIEYNMAMAQEGLTGKYGLGIGKVILRSHGDGGLDRKIKAYTAAGSEARMSGSALPVVTNSGSGNQGMASSIPIVMYAEEMGINQEKLYRGLVFSNLITIHQKTLIGRLSAFCGVVSASCASGAAMTYLSNGTLDQINMTITNTLANVSGIVCDGAKASCGAKIASSLDAAIMAHHLAMENQSYRPRTGILKDDIEATIAAIGRLGKYGMHGTDKEILDIMLNVERTV